jgi:hypothetical protein
VTSSTQTSTVGDKDFVVEVWTVFDDLSTSSKFRRNSQSVEYIRENDVLGDAYLELKERYWLWLYIYIFL